MKAASYTLARRRRVDGPARGIGSLYYRLTRDDDDTARCNRASLYFMSLVDLLRFSSAVLEQGIYPKSVMIPLGVSVQGLYGADVQS